MTVLRRGTGYSIREGSAILATHRARREAEQIEAARKVRASFVRGWQRKQSARKAA